ncbi:hypothetical protein A2U01_0045825, partial [Trifolium medium]|nr:hypothetical protein [Trifolium medium]
QVSPPKPPDLGDSGNGKGNHKMEEYLRVGISEGEKNLEEIRVKWAFDDKVRLKWTIEELGQHTSLLSHESPKRHSLSSVMCLAYTMQMNMSF